MPKENEQGQEKTEKPTHRRIKKARNEGNVARSQEVNSAAVMAAGVVTLLLFGGWVMARLTTLISGIYLGLDEIGIDLSNIQGRVKGTAIWLLNTLLPFALIIMITGVIVNLLQFGFLWSTKSIKPKLSKLNPLSGFKQLFNQRGAVKLITNIVKVIVVGYVAYTVVKKAFPHFVPLMDSDVDRIWQFLVDTILELVLTILALMIVIAIIDFAYQKYKYTEQLKMSKQEVKDEQKMQEGDPKVKAHIRQMQAQLAFNTMMKKLPDADVVITNPIHVAVALQYSGESMDAPTMVGKGLRKLAERIKEIAREHDIPIVENPPLARALYKECDVGEEIPGQFYQDVAEILAQIYQLRGDEIPE